MEQFEAINVEQAYTRWKRAAPPRSTSAIRKVLKPGIRRAPFISNATLSAFMQQNDFERPVMVMLPRQQQPQRVARYLLHEGVRRGLQHRRAASRLGPSVSARRGNLYLIPAARRASAASPSFYARFRGFSQIRLPALRISTL